MDMRKGTFILSIAWSVQLLAGFAINRWLGLYLGPELYGTYGVIMETLLWLEIGVISGIPVAIQKFIAADESKAKVVLQKASVLQVWVMAVIFSVSFFMAPFIAKIYQEPQFTFFLKIAILDIWVYGFFFVFVSLQNGLRHFKKQAFLIGFYAVCKLGFVLLLTPRMSSITGALWANIAGSVLGLAAGIFFAKKEKWVDTVSFDPKPFFRFAAPVAVFALFIQLFQNVGLWLVRYFIGDAASGQYYSALIIAKVPYYIFFALSAVVLPVLSRAISNKDDEQIAHTIQSSLRFLTLILLPLCAMVVAYGSEFIQLFYSPIYAAGGQALRVLIWGTSFLALYYLLTTILHADGRPGLSLSITVFVLILNIVLNVIFISKFKIFGAAAATGLSLAVGCITAGIFVYRRFRIWMTWKTLIRIFSATTIIYAISQIISVQGILIIPVCLCLFLLYCALLMLLKEIKVNEIRGVIGR